MLSLLSTRFSIVREWKHEESANITPWTNIIKQKGTYASMLPQQNSVALYNTVYAVITQYSIQYCTRVKTWRVSKYYALNEHYKTKRYSCIYVTATKPNFPECFQIDIGKNWNMPTKCMKTISRQNFFSFFFKWQGCSHVWQLLILPISFLVFMRLLYCAEIITWLFRNSFLTWGGEGVL